MSERCVFFVIIFPLNILAGFEDLFDHTVDRFHQGFGTVHRHGDDRSGFFLIDVEFEIRDKEPAVGFGIQPAGGDRGDADISLIVGDCQIGIGHVRDQLEFLRVSAEFVIVTFLDGTGLRDHGRVGKVFDRLIFVGILFADQETIPVIRIIIFVMILPLQLLAVLLEPAWALLCQATHDLWQMTAPSSHGMYATMALRMKENTKTWRR